MDSWQTIVQTFAIGGFPWISQFKRLKIHFVSTDIDVAGVANFFASLFAMAIFAYLAYAHPSQALDLPPWWLSLLAAALLCLLLLGHFIYLRQGVQSQGLRWPILVHIVLYMAVFAMLTLGFGTLKLLDQHFHHPGQVVNADTGAPIVDAKLRVVDANDAVITAAVSGADGRYSMLIEKSKAAGIAKIEVFANGHDDLSISVSDSAHLLGSLRDLRMTVPPPPAK